MNDTVFPRMVVVEAYSELDPHSALIVCGSGFSKFDEADPDPGQ